MSIEVLESNALIHPKLVNANANGGTISWSKTDYSLAEYIFVQTDVDPNSVQGTIVNNTVENYTATGLEPNTLYSFYIRNISPEGSASAWSRVNLRTLQTATTTPFFESFETDSSSSLWTLLGNGANTFTIGSDNSYDGNRSLYISQNDSLNTYNILSTSLSYA